MADTTTSHVTAAEPRGAADRGVAIWLFICAGAIFAMIVIGGITRLTESGLSMVEWRPLYGFLPPLNDAEWQRIFTLYRQSPQFRLTFPDMTLPAFKSIFWWEYAHRLWGRLIGLVFVLPLLWFVVRKRVGGDLARRLAAILVLGGLQGLLGWYMVQSGLVDRPEVSQYRLTAHLGLALVLYAYIVWSALALWPSKSPATASAAARPAARQTLALIGLLAMTIAAGGFMAGTDAGRAYNSFPLMNGALLPAGYFADTPWFANFFENIAAINFNHRWLGTITALFAVHVWIKARRAGAPAARVAALLPLVAGLQFALGLATLLLAVPVALAAAHQAGAVLLLTVAIWLYHVLRRAP